VKTPRIDVPPGSGRPYVRARQYKPALSAAVADAHAAAMGLSALDPITTELVRLRCGFYQDCAT
jgi:hypothetical protein